MKTFIAEKWNTYLYQFSDEKRDVYYFEEYVKLYESETGKALCVICLEDEKVVIMPFISKSIGNYYDFETAYGYGGPISNTDDKEWVGKALENIQDYLRENRYVCGFIRFHSLLDNVNLCEKQMTTFFDRNTVAIETGVSEEEIWNTQISSKNRNMIRKAEKNGLTYKAEYNFDSIDEFIELYNATMSRLQADEFYFFDKKYYQYFIENLSNKSFLGTIRKDGVLICAALFMYSEHYGHYHLEGSNHGYSKLGANNLLLWETAKEFHKLGVKYFHLGGGYNSDPDNSLLKFKQAFSKNYKDFYIGKWIINAEKYTQLKETWEKDNPAKIEKYGKYLLCYRY